MTGSIGFIQYLRPDGRRQDVYIDEMPEHLCEKAEKVKAAGYLFEAEVLITGQVSFTVEHSDEDRLDEEGSLSHKVVANGPEVITAVAELVEESFAAIAKAEGQ